MLKINNIANVEVPSWVTDKVNAMARFRQIVSLTVTVSDFVGLHTKGRYSDCPVGDGILVASFRVGSTDYRAVAHTH